MNNNTTGAYDMAIENIIESIKFNIEWYGKEKNVKYSDDEYMYTYCEESVLAYTQLLDYFKHFKFC